MAIFRCPVRPTSTTAVPELRERLKGHLQCAKTKQTEEYLLLFERADGVYENLQENYNEQIQRKGI